MLEELVPVSRTSIVSSRERREFDERVASELSELYHRTLAAVGRANTASLCLKATSAAMLDVVSDLQQAVNAGLVTIDARTAVTYPADASVLQQAEAFREYRVITAKRVSSTPVFTNQQGRLLEKVSPERSTANSLYMARPTSMVENSLNGMFTGDAPYLAKFSYPSAERSNLTVNVRSTGDPFVINALRLTPMPTLGGTSLIYVKYSTLLRPVLNGNLEFPDLTGSVDTDLRMARSFPAYIHFKQIETDVLRLSLESDLYLTDVHAVVMGINRLQAEFNVYALNSYIGWTVTVPTAKTKIVRTKIVPDNFASSVTGARLRIYTNKTEFDRMSNSYLLSAMGETAHNVSLGGATTVYALLDLASTDNTTPCVGKIEIEFA